MAIEDAAALGIIFNKDHFNGDIDEALSVYQEIRLPRVTKVQSAAAKAAYNINERIGKSLPLRRGPTLTIRPLGKHRHGYV